MGRKYGMAFAPFQGICRVSVWTYHFGQVGPSPALLERREVPSMKKVRREDRASVKHLAAMETELFKEHMPLVEHCGMLQYEDGESRMPGWITLRTNGAAWQCSVKDPDSGCSFTTTGKTLDEVIGVASLLLGCDEAPWEPDAWLTAAKARAKKK